MANYKESDIVGTSYQRASQIVINNSLVEKSISFQEENCIVLSDDKVFTEQLVSNLTEFFTQDNANTSFNLLNPDSDEILGSSTYQEVYVTLYSLYRHLADKRDSDESVISTSAPV